MHRLPLRLLLPTALAMTLAACGDEGPQPARPVSDDVSADDDANSATPTRPQGQSPKTPFETAMTALSRRNGVHFEAELSLPSGRVEYASGDWRGDQAAFTIRSLPQPTPDLDGSWYAGGGRFMKQTASGYDSSILLPETVTLMQETVLAFPRKQDSLSSEATPMDQGAGVSCQPRSVSMAASPELLSRYQSLSVCVDEAESRVVKLNARTQAGAELTAVFSGHGQPVVFPDVKVFDWSQEYPRQN